MKLSTLFRIVLTILLVSHFALNDLYSEGSKDFVNYPGERLFFHAQVPQQLKVFARSGEFINFGASHVGITGGSIKVYRPDGSLHSIFDNNGITEGFAIINNHIEERAGPTGGGTVNGLGYKPGVVNVGENEEGVWTFTLEFPKYNIQTFINLQNDDPWNRDDHQPLIQRVITAWDITISQGQAANNGGLMVEGRVYSNEYASIVNLVSATTSPTFYVLTKDGITYEVIFGDVHPWGFPINSNSIGLLKGDGIPYYKSNFVDNIIRITNLNNMDPSKLYLYEPQAQDLGDLIVNNKIFFNEPDVSMPLYSMVTDIFRNNTHETWLYRSPNSLAVNFEVLDFIPAQSGPSFLPPDVIDLDQGGYFVIDINRDASLKIILDINHDGDFEDEIDRAIYGKVSKGIDSLFWDMKDGEGNEIEASDTPVMYDFRLFAGQGEIHIALSDIEENPGGITFKRLNGLNAPEEGVYYDHTSVGGGFSGGILPNLLESTTVPYTYADYWGNRKYLDYFSFEALPFQDLQVEFIAVRQGYLLEDTDLDGIPDAMDIDDDNDGIPDFREYCDINGGIDCLPLNIEPWGDNDGDGIKNYIDSEDPSFFIPCDTIEEGVCANVAAIFDSDGDGRPNHLDADSDNDGILDVIEAGHGALDLNRDGLIDGDAMAFGGNGLYNALATDPNDIMADIKYDLLDSDSDQIANFLDLDSDNDGIPEIIENGLHIYDNDDDGRIDPENGLQTLQEKYLGVSPSVHWLVANPIPESTPDQDEDGVPNHVDLDSDNDGIHDIGEAKYDDPDNDGIWGESDPLINDHGLPSHPPGGNLISTGVSRFYFPQYDTDRDGIPDFLDLDSDNDGIHDVMEAGFSDGDNDGIIGTGIGTTSTTGITIADAILVPFFLTSSPNDSDIDGIADFNDLDSDNDGIYDVLENRKSDGDNDGFVGNGILDFNKFGQAIDISNGNILFTSSEISDFDNDNIPDFRDRDSDNDGINDVAEALLLDEDNDGAIGIGIVSVDSFGVFNLNQTVTSFPNDADTDLVFNFRDLDSDNDGILDVVEGGGVDPDTDGKLGIGDPIVDYFGMPQFGAMGTSLPIDTDLNGQPDFLSLDSDADLIPDVIEAELIDGDGDGRLGFGNGVDENGLGIDLGASPPILVTSDPIDSDGDGLQDYRDLDSDDDGLPDSYECPSLDCRDLDLDGIVDYKDPDRDNDGILDRIECPTLDCRDLDGDGLPDVDDLDSDGDLLTDAMECPDGAPCPDLDLTSVVDVYEYTCHIGVTPTLNNTSESGVFCLGKPILLSSQNTTSSVEQMEYSWSFPDGSTFTNTAKGDEALNLDIPIATIDMAGIFSIEASTEFGCISEENFVLVDLIDVPVPANLIAAKKEVCIGDVIEIDATNITTNGLSYDWYLDDGNGKILFETTTSPTLIITEADPEIHQGSYSMVIAGPNCNSDTSNLEYITVRGGIDEALATNSSSDISPGCSGTTINLFTEGIIGAEYYWTGPNGFTSTEQNPVLENISETNQGEYTVQVVIPGCAEATSEPTTVFVSSFNQEKPVLSAATSVCIGSDLTLEVLNDYDLPAGTQILYEWYSAVSGNIVGTSAENEINLGQVTPATAGSYYVVVNIGECTTLPSDLQSVIVEEAPLEKAYIPENQIFLCNENTIEITASSPSSGQGNWSTNSNVRIINPANETTVVTDIQPEVTEIYWSLSIGSCINYSTDTLYILPADRVTAEEDIFNVDLNTPLTNVSIISNDSPLSVDQMELSILQNPSHGQVVNNGNGLITYVPDNNFIGTDEFTYELCNADCIGSCDVATVFINVESTDCKVPNIITPNADGMNDTFIVPCSANHPNNELFIMNRWGDRVYSAKKYKNEWDGSFNGNELPPGTYFYLYRPNDSSETEMTGFITLVR